MVFFFFTSSLVHFFPPDLNPGADQKVHQHRLDLGLTRFEVIPTDEDPFLHSQLDDPGYKSVLRGSIDVGASLQYTGHCKQSGGRNLCPSLMDRDLTNKREAMTAKYVVYTERRNTWETRLLFPWDSSHLYSSNLTLTSCPFQNRAICWRSYSKSTKRSDSRQQNKLPEDST